MIIWLLCLLSLFPSGEGAVEVVARYESLHECAAHIRITEENYGGAAFCRPAAEAGP